MFPGGSLFFLFTSCAIVFLSQVKALVAKTIPINIFISKILVPVAIFKLNKKRNDFLRR